MMINYITEKEKRLKRLKNGKNGNGIGQHNV